MLPFLSSSITFNLPFPLTVLDEKVFHLCAPVISLPGMATFCYVLVNGVLVFAGSFVGIEFSSDLRSFLGILRLFLESPCSYVVHILAILGFVLASGLNCWRELGVLLFLFLLFPF